MHEAYPLECADSERDFIISVIDLSTLRDCPDSRERVWIRGAGTLEAQGPPLQATTLTAPSQALIADSHADPPKRSEGG